jgi:hypothetical protein
MPLRRENHIAILLADIVFWLFGAVWYNSLSSPWLAASGRTIAQTQRYGLVPFVAALGLGWLAAYGIAKMLSFSANHSPIRGAQIGAFLAICIFATVSRMQILFEGHDLMLFAIDGGYGVIGMALMGALIGWMKPGAAV